MAVSTSASTEERVPSTIWRTIGSTTGIPDPPEHQVGEAVDLEVEVGVHDGGGAVLVHDDRSPLPEPGGQLLALVARWPAGAAGLAPRSAAFRRRPERRPVDQAQ